MCYFYRNIAGASLQQALMLTGGQPENLAIESNQSELRKLEASQSELRRLEASQSEQRRLEAGQSELRRVEAQRMPPDFLRQNSTGSTTTTTHQEWNYDDESRDV